eukprot:Phypoly_transcript_03665.p1 GENE.Phypoly_transcript_03665~~Phypoly_transcript_03665.p1  ORF type:complete len:773 (+),score=92.52 Phypoly_transcript_03665:11-2329(+)
MRAVFLLGFLALCCSAWKIRNEQADDPRPNPEATVLVGKSRFTILTPQLIRMEWSGNGVFVDEASLVFINRNLPAPAFTVQTSGQITTITTESLTLTYDQGPYDSNYFEANSLNISFSFNSSTVVWYPGLENTGNLNGTLTSLDCYNWNCTDGMPLQPGLISTNGWYVYDDSSTPLFNYSVNDGMPWIVTPKVRTDSADWYFFGYGWNFKQLLFDFSQVAGPITIPPVSAFGSWWSRYYNYSQQTITDQVIDGYKNHSLPLNHLVLDMDWHTEIQDKQCNTWGGYTWNTGLFPNPPEFIDWLHGPDNELKLLLNIHPNTGVDVCQAKYLDLAKAIGFDTSQNATIPCDFLSHFLSTNQFNIVMDPVGNDYWWTDYGGCSNGETVPSQFNLLWSNYVFNAEQFSQGKRPLVLSRFGGVGNHRYPIGFSGDAYSVWTTLAFEVYMTPTAANVLFGYWSHDTGGFHGDYNSGNPNVGDELFLRWLQFASVAPIFRIHSDHQERRIWMFPSYQSMKLTLLFRNMISPYIYSQARKTYDTGIAIVHPLYYDFPETPQAYSYKYQYMFGEDMFVAPIVTPGNNITNTTSKSIWLPPGQWYDWNAMKLIEGPSEFTQIFPWAQWPIYVRAGAIIPMKDMTSVTRYCPDPLIFSIFPGSYYGQTQYYEDDGNSTQYQNGDYSITYVSYSADSSGLMKVLINAPQGTFIGQPATRTFQVVIVTGGAPKSAQFSSPSGSTTLQEITPENNATAGWWLASNGLVLQSTPGTTSLADISFSVQF